MYEISKAIANGEDYEKAIFVIKAMSDDFTRPNMCVVHVEGMRTGSRLVCTDGRRLHIVELDMKIPSGDYTPEVTKTTVFLRNAAGDIVFPNWKKVVPSAVNAKGSISFETSGMGNSSTKCAGMSIAFSKVIEKTGEVVNLRYLDDLPKTEWQVLSQGEKHKAIVFKRESKGKESIAVIMPMDIAA
jgi:hypothetical protein